MLTESPAIKNQTISALMLPNERKWDEDLIKEIFVQCDANLILATPLSDNNEDNWYWMKEKYGNFLVKTAYTLIQESEPLVNQCGNTRFWKRLWNLTVPPKIKNFMWRAITGCLLTKDMLRIKQVNINVECSLCNREAESTSHVLLKCSYARSCWEMVSISRDDTTHDSFIGWALNVFNEWSTTKRQLGAMVCWTIWKCRNYSIWNQKCMEVQEAVNSARVVLSRWKEAQDKFFDRSCGLLNPDDGDELWSPPTENKTKINTDAAVFESSNCYSFAFAARNHKRDLIEARSSCKEGYTSPECAEAMVIREALSWIKAKQLNDTIVETDCLVVVQAIRGRAEMSSYFGY